MPACAHRKTQAQHNIPEICRLDNHQIELCGVGFYKFLECGHLNIKRAPYPYRREKFTGKSGWNICWVSRSFNIVLRLTARHLAS